MIAGWVITGVGWGVILACAVTTFAVITGMVLGILSVIRAIARGGKGNEASKKDAGDKTQGGGDVE